MWYYSYNLITVIFFRLTETAKETETEIETGIVIVTVSEIVNVTKIVNVTGSVTEIVIATVTVKKNVGNTEAGHAKKSVTATVTGERCSYKL